MKIGGGNSKTSSNIQTGGRSFGIVANGKAFRILSSSLYNFKILAVVREISCNARDAHALNGSLDRPFKVTLPTVTDPHFSVRDFGPGLADEDIFGLYTTYFQSTKTDSNDAIGGLGLGSKSPLSYSNSFTVSSVHGGKKRTYLTFQNDNGEPDIYRLTEEDSDEPTGLEVRVPVVREDFDKFKASATYVYRLFQTRPDVWVGHTEIGVEGLERDTYVLADRLERSVAYEGTKAARFYKSCTVSEVSNSKFWAKMGDLIYPIAIDHVFAKSDGFVYQFYTQNRGQVTIVDCEIGELDINAGREGLSYDKSTLARLKTVLSLVYAKMVKEVNDQIAVATHFDQAMTLAVEQRKYFGDMASSGMFSWKGTDLSLSYYNSFPQLVKHSASWQKFVAVFETFCDRVNYSHVQTSTNGLVVRSLTPANIERALMFFYEKTPIKIIVQDQTPGGANGSIKQRVEAAYGTRPWEKHQIFIVRACTVQDTANGGQTTSSAHAKVAENIAAVRKAIQNCDVFADIIMLSDLPTCAPEKATSTRGATVARQKSEMYVVTSTGLTNIHMLNVHNFVTVEFDPEATGEFVYVVGNKSSMSFGGTINLSRSTQTTYRGEMSYAVDVIHEWVKSKLTGKTPIAEKVSLYYLTEAQAKEIEGLPNWTNLQTQIIRDVAAAIKQRNGQRWVQTSINRPADSDINSYLLANVSDYRDAHEEFKALNKEYGTYVDHMLATIKLIANNCMNLIENQKAEFEALSGCTVKVFKERLAEPVSVTWYDFVCHVSPMLAMARLYGSSSKNKPWTDDLCRLWNESPKKITFSEYLNIILK